MLQANYICCTVLHRGGACCFLFNLQWVRTLLEQGNTVVATGRDPDASPGLKELAQQYGDKLILTKLEAASEESITAWAEGLKGTVSHIDVSPAGVGCNRLLSLTVL